MSWNLSILLARTLYLLFQSRSPCAILPVCPLLSSISCVPVCQAPLHAQKNKKTITPKQIKTPVVCWEKCQRRGPCWLWANTFSAWGSCVSLALCACLFVYSPKSFRRGGAFCSELSHPLFAVWLIMPKPFFLLATCNGVKFLPRGWDFKTIGRSVLIQIVQECTKEWTWTIKCVAGF